MALTGGRGACVHLRYGPSRSVPAKPVSAATPRPQNHGFTRTRPWALGLSEARPPYYKAVSGGPLPVLEGQGRAGNEDRAGMATLVTFENSPERPR